MEPFEDKIESLLSASPYAQPPEEKQAALLEVLQQELAYAAHQHAGYRNYLERWPVNFTTATAVADLPFLPVGVLKADPPLVLVAPEAIKKVLTSSATTSQQPSRVAIDSPTARRMTKGVVSIVRDVIGPARRPYLVVDTSQLAAGAQTMGARGAAIQGLQPFAMESSYCLGLTNDGSLELDRDVLAAFAGANHDREVLVYGFTYILWKYLAKPLLAEGVCLNLPGARVMHSGGWKRLHDEAVGKATFNRTLAEVFGCSPARIVDFYGMVESVGVIFPDCPEGNKHAPAFGEVIVRDALTLKPVAPGECGLIEVCSVLPTSFPGHLLLTEDRGQVITYDGCACGRRGISFRFAGRVAKAEVRGCGNLRNTRAAVN